MKKKILSLLLVLAVLLSSISINSSNTYAADGTVKIFLGDSDTPRHHKAIAEGSRSEELSFELKEGTVKTSSFSSDNPDSFKIVKENGKTYIDGISEGVGYVTLNIETTTGKKYKERLFISVYKGTGTYLGIINISAGVYRGASTNADVENLDYKGELQKNTKVYVVAKCKEFYLIRTLDGSVFEDNKDTGFVKKSMIGIPVAKIELDKNNLTLKKGERAKIIANVLPDIANDKNAIFTSSDSNIVAVSEKGICSAKKDGEATITVKAGDKTATCKVFVAGEYIYEKLKLNKTNETVVIGELIKLHPTSGVVDEYTSSDNNLATVDKAGNIEAIAPGVISITAKSLYGEAVICKVTIKYPNAPKVSFKKTKKKNEYRLSWKKVSGVTGYQVYKYKSKKNRYKKYKTIKKSSGQKLIVPKGKYKVRAYKKNKKGKSYYSAFTVAKLSKKNVAKYKIIYVGNGGIGKTYSQTLDFNKKIRMKANKFNRKGFAFVGWSKSKNGEVILKNKARVKKLTNKKKIKLYAIWRSDNDPNGKLQRQGLIYANKSDPILGNCMDNDASLIKKVLDYSNFVEGKVRTSKITDFKVSQYKKRIKIVGQNTTLNDITYIYFSCHGSEDASLLLMGNEYVYAKALREWLDDYVDGKVVLMLDLCYSGIFMREHIDIDKTFVDEFSKAGTGKVELKKNGKYKIITSSGEDVSFGGNPVSLATGYWAKGLGFTNYGEESSMYADLSDKDDEGNICYGNNDSKITLNELYKYAAPPIYEVLKNGGCGKNNYPQVYPKNDNFLIYQR